MMSTYTPYDPNTVVPSSTDCYPGTQWPLTDPVTGLPPPYQGPVMQHVMAYGTVRNGRLQFTDLAGKPLAFGRVFTYESQTENFKSTFKDLEKTQPNPNPILLDKDGEATIYWEGNYYIKVVDYYGNVVWEADPVSDVTYMIDAIRGPLAEAEAAADRAEAEADRAAAEADSIIGYVDGVQESFVRMNTNLIETQTIVVQHHAFK